MAKSREEKAVLKRAKELKYPTDRLGPGSLMIQQSHTNSSRVIMANSQLTHMVSIKDPEAPLVPTGFENLLAEYSSMLNKADADYEVVAKFEKNPYNYVLIGFDKKKKRYHAWKRVEMEEHSEGFSTRYNNRFMDSLEVGDTIPKGTYVQKSANYDKTMNYEFGRNINVVYLVSPHVYEDGILAMNGVDEMFNTYRSHTVEITLSDNEILLNWYGDEDHYQGIPLVGEKTRHDRLAVVRRVESAKAPYLLKRAKLRHIDRGSDRVYYATGRVVDIEILTNKDPKKMQSIGANRIISDLYNEQQDYYRKLYSYMQDIVDNADSEGYTYTDDFSIICEEAHDYVDSSAFFADSSDNVYGSTKVVIHLLDEEKMIVGSKFVGRSGNKGVISKILKPEESWHMEDGTPIHFVVATLGIIGRLNQSQLNEHSCNELGATAVRAMKATKDVDQKAVIVYRLLKYLNPEEAEAWKKWVSKLSKEEKAKLMKKTEKNGITIVQDPIENANIINFANAYEEFPPNYQHIIFEDGGRSMRKVLCAKMFYMRLKQDPLEKYSVRSRGPVNPLTTLPAKSNNKKKFLIPFSDVAVRFGEMELEILMGMVNHPAAIADFMMENSTSFEAKLEFSEKNYLSDPEEEVEVDNIMLSGKKNIEWISAYLNVLGSEIVIDSEEAPPGETYED